MTTVARVDSYWSENSSCSTNRGTRSRSFIKNMNDTFLRLPSSPSPKHLPCALQEPPQTELLQSKQRKRCCSDDSWRGACWVEKDGQNNPSNASFYKSPNIPTFWEYLEATTNTSAKAPLGDAAAVGGATAVELWLLVDMDKASAFRGGWAQPVRQQEGRIWQSADNGYGGLMESKESVVVTMLQTPICFSRVFLSVESKPIGKKIVVSDKNNKSKKHDDNQTELLVNRCRWLLGRVTCSAPEQWPRYAERLVQPQELAPEYRVYDTNHRAVPVDCSWVTNCGDGTDEALWTDYGGDPEAVYRTFSSPQVSRGKRSGANKRAAEESGDGGTSEAAAPTSDAPKTSSNVCGKELKNYHGINDADGGGTAVRDYNPPCLQMFARSPERHLRASCLMRTQRFLVIGSSRLMRTMIQTALHRRMGNMVRNGSLSILSLQTMKPCALLYSALHRLRPPSSDEATTALLKLPRRLQQQSDDTTATEEEQDEAVTDWVGAAGMRCYLEVFNERISSPIIAYPPDMFS
eukprot:GHVS01034992.1.p1 GENE.GHVS01034992.1~~GHVS01034992.1.p1  ORF type:complete len:520 (-),score=76.90 GHVS01034992.1:1922-3481(-)